MGTAEWQRDAQKWRNKQKTEKLFLSQISSVRQGRAISSCMRRIITKRYQFWFQFCLWNLINPRLRLVASRRRPSLSSSVINFINSLTSQLSNYISSESRIQIVYRPLLQQLAALRLGCVHWAQTLRHNFIRPEAERNGKFYYMSAGNNAVLSLSLVLFVYVVNLHSCMAFYINMHNGLTMLSDVVGRPQSSTQ